MYHQILMLMREKIRKKHERQKDRITAEGSIA